MNTSLWLRWLLATLAVLALALFAACGDDDDDDSDSDDGNNSETRDDADETDDDDSGAADPSDADERYVAQLCEALGGFTDAITSIPQEDLLDEERQFEVLEDPIREFVEGIEDADPPDDAEDYHEEAVEHMRAYLEAVENRDQAALDELDAIEFPDAPAELEQRLSAAARENEVCQETGFAF